MPLSTTNLYILEYEQQRKTLKSRSDDLMQQAQHTHTLDEIYVCMSVLKGDKNQWKFKLDDEYNVMCNVFETYKTHRVVQHHHHHRHLHRHRTATTLFQI